MRDDLPPKGGESESLIGSRAFSSTDAGISPAAADIYAGAAGFAKVPEDWLIDAVSLSNGR